MLHTELLVQEVSDMSKKEYVAPELSIGGTVAEKTELQHKTPTNTADTYTGANFPVYGSLY